MFCFCFCFCFAPHSVSRSFHSSLSFCHHFPPSCSCPWTPKTSSPIIVRLLILPTGHHMSIPLVRFSRSRLDVAAAFPRILFVPILSASVWLSYVAPFSSSMILCQMTLLFRLSWACCAISLSGIFLLYYFRSYFIISSFSFSVFFYILNFLFFLL